MKKLVFFLLMMSIFFSCTKDNGRNSVFGLVLNIAVQIVIVDEALQDRLNPESPSYLGEEYTNGIEVFYLYNGKKVTFLELYHYSGGGSRFFIDDVENHQPIFPPKRDGHIDQGTLGFYFIDCTSPWGYANVIEDEREVTYTYIRYPDGSEDEIKVQYLIEETLYLYEKIWINGVLAFERGAWGEKEFYYNTKYYPFLEPLLDDAGKQRGVAPKNGTNIVVITK